MGRGRAKAKQAKVARQLKYQTGGTSIEALREELGAAPTPTVSADEDVDGESHDDSYYDSYDDPYDDEDDESPQGGPSGHPGFGSNGVEGGGG